jgi:pimeloyl-ACP methyl ester carboxylesterase
MDRLLVKRSPAHLIRTVRLVLVFPLIAMVALAGLSCRDGTATETIGGGIQGTQVTFRTEDGILLSGHTFGSGTAGVVLSHMYPADQESWYPTAKKLAAEGYLVLCYDFRGYGYSEGNKQIEYIDRDVFAAVEKIAAAGATHVVLIGASMGGTASLMTAERLFAGQLSSAQARTLHITVAGVATLSAPVSFKGLSAKNSVKKLYCPLLFVAAKEDEGASEALELERLSGNTGQLKIFSGSDHGTALLEGSHADEVYELLLDFLRKNMPVENQRALGQ